MAEAYDFNAIFSQSTQNLSEDDMRAYNTLYLSEKLGRPVEDVEKNYNEVASNFIGENAENASSSFQRFHGVLNSQEGNKEWVDSAASVVGGVQPTYKDSFLSESWTRLWEGIEFGDVVSGDILATMADVIPSFARGGYSTVRQVAESAGYEDFQQDMIDTLANDTFFARAMETPLKVIEEMGKFKENMRSKRKELAEEYGKPAVVVDELTTTVVDTTIFLQAMRLGGIKIGMTPAQAANGELSKQMASRLMAAGKIGAFRALFSEANSLEERANIAAVTTMYMSTPAASGVFQSGKNVFLADLMLNSTITAPQLNDLWARDDIDDFDKILESVKMVGADIVFSSMTKTMRANRLSPDWKPMKDASDTLVRQYDAVKDFGRLNAEVARLQELNAKFEQKPPSGDRLNRVQGESDKATQEGQGFVRAEEAKVTSESDIKALENILRDQAGDGKPADDSNVRASVVLDTINQTKGMDADKRVDEINRTIQEVSDPVQASLHGLERIMNSDKGTEVVKTDADIGDGKIKGAVKAEQKASVELKPPEPTADIDSWVSDQIKYISSLMRMGEIKNKSDYEKILDTYKQHEDSDKDIVYNEAKKAVKTFEKRMKAAEKASAKARVTQKQFKGDKDIIRVDEYQMLKKQIRDYNKGVKSGKKLGKEQEVARRKEREAKIEEIRKIARGYADSQIHNRDLRNSVNNTINKIKTDSQLDKLLEKIDKVVEEQKHQDALSGVNKELKSMKKMKFHPNQQKQIDVLLDGIATKKTSDKKLGSLAKSKEFFESDIHDMKFELPDYLEKAMGELEKKQLRDLTTDDLITLRSALQNIKAQQKLRENLTKQGQVRKIENLATDFDKQVSDPNISPLYRLDKEGAIKDPKRGGVASLINSVDLNPDGWAFIVDGGREGVFHDVMVKNFWAGEDRMLKIKQMASSQMEPYHDTIQGWDKRDLTETIGGNKVKISRGERIAMYLDSLNPQNESHQLKGGYVLRSDPDTVYRITEAERDAIIDKMTPDDFKVAATIHSGYDNILRNAINEASTKVVGYDIATIDTYHPMVSAKTISETDRDTVLPGSLRAMNEYLIDSSGHFKERTKGAKNPIVLQDAIKKYDQMVDLAARYNGFAEPLRDAKQFLDAKTADGIPVRKIISSTVGSRYSDMAGDLLKDIEQGYEKSNRSFARKANAVVNRATNKIVRGILGHNVKIATLQPVSYEASLNVLPAKYHAIGRVSMPASWEEMGRHSPFLWDRGKGHLSIAFGESTREKRANRGMKMIQEMDRQAVGRIWRATEAWVKDEKGEVDYKEVARRVDDIVRRTQPTFSMIDRPAVARSDNFLFRVLSMFSSQRNKNHTLKLKNDIGMLNKIQRGDATDKDWAEWGKKTLLNRVWTPSIVALHASLWGLLFSKKYEDDDRSFLNRFGNSFVDVSIGEIGPMASALASEGKYLLSELNDSVEGREVSSALISTYKRGISDAQKFAKTFKDDDDIVYEEDYAKTWDKRKEAIEGLIKATMTAAGRGEYHYWDYVQHVRSWLDDDEEEIEFD